MGIVLSTLPDPSQVRMLQAALAEIKAENERLREELREAMQHNRKLQMGTGELRVTLTPLFNALNMVFGVMDLMGVEPSASPASPSPVKNKAVWDSWKSKLGGANARAIDILSLHGPMSVSNLRIHLSCAMRTAQNVAAKLVSTGIATRDNGKISLREL